MTCIDPAYWEEWIVTKYDTPSNCKITPFNSLFLRFFVYQDSMRKESLQECLKTAFDLVPTLHYVLLVLPANTRLLSIYPKLFEKIEMSVDNLSKTANVNKSLNKEEIKSPPTTQLEQEVDTNVQNEDTFHQNHSLSDLELFLEGAKPNDFDLYVCNRHTLLPVLHIRNAREEDSDDLSPLFLRHTDELHSIYGEYFIAELVTGCPEKMGLVAEVNGIAVGYTGVSSEPQLDQLNQHFRLEHYHGLKKISEQDEIVEVEMVILFRIPTNI